MTTPIYELINPSDPYTFKSDDWQAVCVAALFLGEGKYGLKCLTAPSKAMPILAFGGDDALARWWTSEFGGTFTDWMEIDANHERVAAALDTLIIGSVDEREAHEAVLAEIRDPEDQARARAAWLTRKRSSLNDIGGRAIDVAAAMRGTLGKEKK